MRRRPIFYESCPESKPNETQLAFSEKLLESPAITHTERDDRLNLWVKVDPNQLGIHAKTMAQELSNKLAAAGVQETGEAICVKIYFPPALRPVVLALHLTISNEKITICNFTTQKVLQ